MLAVGYSFDLGQGTAAMLQATLDALKDNRKPLSILRRGLEHRLNDQLFQTSVSSGGTVRGEAWAAMAPYYVRKDGSAVPAWGGVAKERGSGTVLGRKRKGGAGRVMADKRFLAPWTGRSVFKYVRMATNAMEISPSTSPQIPAFNSLRQFLFWNDADTAELPKILQVWIDRHLERAANG